MAGAPFPSSANYPAEGLRGSFDDPRRTSPSHGRGSYPDEAGGARASDPSSSTVGLPPERIASQTLKSPPARVSLNGKEYLIEVKRPGCSKSNPATAVSQKFATLIGISLKYGIAALENQHKLDTRKIKLKNVKIIKKTNGDIFLRYVDNKTKYKVQITNNLDINETDSSILKNEIGEEKELKTADKTFEKAIELLEIQSSIGASASSDLYGLYDLKLDTNCLSENSKKFYSPDSDAKIKPKSLKSKGKSTNTSKPEEKDKKTEDVEIAPSKKDKKADPSSKEEEHSDDPKVRPDGGDASPEGAEVATDPSEISEGGDAASAASEEPKAEIGPSKLKSDEKDNPFKVSEEEKDISMIPFKKSDGDIPHWKLYLSEGILENVDRGDAAPKREGVMSRLFSSRSKAPKDNVVERSVNPQSFSNEKIKEIMESILDLDNESSIDEFENDKKVFLKRFLLHCLAYMQNRINEKNYDKEKRADYIKDRLLWINDEYSLDCENINKADERKQEIYQALEKTLKEIEKQTDGLVIS